MWYHCIKLEFQEIINFVTTFVTKNGLKPMINQEENTMLIKKLELKRQC